MLKHNFCLNDLLTKSNRTTLRSYKVEERTFGTPCKGIRPFFSFGRCFGSWMTSMNSGVVNLMTLIHDISTLFSQRFGSNNSRGITMKASFFKIKVMKKGRNTTLNLLQLSGFIVCWGKRHLLPTLWLWRCIITLTLICFIKMPEIRYDQCHQFVWSICLLWQLHGALSTREHDLTVDVNQIFKSEIDFLEDELKRVHSWKSVLESVKQRAESAIQTSGSDELHICILNAKSELENALEKPEPGKREQRTDRDVKIVSDRRSFLNTLHTLCGRVLQQVFEDKSETI